MSTFDLDERRFGVQRPNSGLATGIYPTMFFIRVPYNGVSSSNVASKQNAQFCRSCHGGEANEMNGGGATSISF